MVRQVPDLLLNSGPLVELIQIGKFIDEKYLSAFKAHAVASIAMERNNELPWVVFEGFLQVRHKARIIFEFRVYQELDVFVLGAEL